MGAMVDNYKYITDINFSDTDGLNGIISIKSNEIVLNEFLKSRLYDLLYDIYYDDCDDYLDFKKEYYKLYKKYKKD